MHGHPPQSFVDIRRSSLISFDIAYARTDNFTGNILPGYGQPGAWLHQDAAECLFRTIETLKRLKLGLVVWDAYRPFRATQQMVQWANDTDQAYLVEEGYIARRSRHNSGIAIDVGLIKDGVLLDMGTQWDDFSHTSHTLHATGTALRNRLLLQGIMHAHGWIGYSKEWWHFQLPNGAQYPIRDVPYGTQEHPESPEFREGT